MGLLSWIRGSRSRTPRPPWVRPEFLGLFALVLTASVGIGYWSLHDGQPGGDAVAGTTRRDYIGIEPTDLAAPLPCEPACYADWLFAAWLRDHPDAEILRKEPRYYDGVLLGYDVEYR